MKKLCFLLAALIVPLASAQAQDLDLTGFQQEEGAITSGYNGNSVDPYFATKALLMAKDAGLKTTKPTLAWINWAINMQCSDGVFERYVRDNDGIWHSLADADADDAMSALWLELLYRSAPASGMPASWQASAAKTEKALSRLYDKNQGIYLISESNQVGLLMDNIEIYASFKRVAGNAHRLGDSAKATEYNSRADRLAKNILKVFKPENSDRFAVSTQAREPDDATFYPDKVAQIYPVLYRLPAKQDQSDAYKRWISANTKEWMEQRNDDPWGLVAVTALSMNDDDTASCWQNRAEPMRYGQHWNVLEEVALQQVKAKIAADHNDKIPCVGIEL